MKTFNLSIVSPEKDFFNDTVVSVLTESVNGYLEVLPDHMPLLVTLRPCTTSFKKADGEELSAFTSNGLMLVKKGEVTIICDSCEWPEEIDLDRAEAAKDRAEEMISDEKADKARAELALKKAIARIKLKSE